MNTFEYITVLMSIVVGLAIGEMCLSLHRLMRARRRVRWDWLVPLAALHVVLLLFIFWWKWHGAQLSTLGAILPFFAILIVLFLLAACVLPDEISSEGIDLAAYWADNRRYFWILFAGFVATYVGLRSIQPPSAGASLVETREQLYFDIPAIVIYSLMIFVRARWADGMVLAASLTWLTRDFWAQPLGF